MQPLQEILEDLEMTFDEELDYNETYITEEEYNKKKDELIDLHKFTPSKYEEEVLKE